MSFSPGKAFQDAASPDDRVDRISFLGVGGHFTITTIDSLLHHFILRLKMDVNKIFLKKVVPIEVFDSGCFFS